MKKINKPLPDMSILRDRYEERDGVLLNRYAFSRKSKAGIPAGRIDSRGYCYVCINSGFFLAHRIVYALFFGNDPGSKLIDHIDGNPRNNRPANLRACEHTQNMANRNGCTKHNVSSGVRNIEFRSGGYRVRIKRDGITFVSKTFRSKDLAIALARKKRGELFAEFAGKDGLERRP